MSQKSAISPITRYSTPTSQQNVVQEARPQSKQAWPAQVEPKTARERASFKNKVPFSEHMYETLKTTIQMLSDRIKTSNPLSVQESEWLQTAVELIITDANLYGPPEKPKRIEEDGTQEE